MSPNPTVSSTAEPKSPSTQTHNPSTRPYLAVAKLVPSLLVFVLTIISASVWPQHMHPVFLCTLFTCLITFTILIYSHTHPTTGSSNISYRIVTLILLHILPLILWVTSSVLTSVWTYTYHTTTWRSGILLDTDRTYLAELPPGLTPAKIASDYFRRYRTVKYSAAVRMTGVCAGLAGLTAILFLASSVAFIRNMRQDRGAQEMSLAARDRQTLRVPGCAWLAAVVSRVKRKETLPLTENENKGAVVSTGSSFLKDHAGELGSGAAPIVGGFVADNVDQQHDKEDEGRSRNAS